MSYPYPSDLSVMSHRSLSRLRGVAKRHYVSVTVLKAGGAP